MYIFPRLRYMYRKLYYYCLFKLLCYFLVDRKVLSVCLYSMRGVSDGNLDSSGTSVRYDHSASIIT